MAVTVHTAATWMYPNGRCCRCVRLDTIPMATVVSEPLRVSVPCEFSVFLQTLALSLSVCLSVKTMIEQLMLGATVALTTTLWHLLPWTSVLAFTSQQHYS